MEEPEPCLKAPLRVALWQRGPASCRLHPLPHIEELKAAAPSGNQGGGFGDSPTSPAALGFLQASLTTGQSPENSPNVKSSGVSLCRRPQGACKEIWILPWKFKESIAGSGTPSKSRHFSESPFVALIRVVCGTRPPGA